MNLLLCVAGVICASAGYVLVRNWAREAWMVSRHMYRVLLSSAPWEKRKLWATRTIRDAPMHPHVVYKTSPIRALTGVINRGLFTMTRIPAGTVFCVPFSLREKVNDGCLRDRPIDSEEGMIALEDDYDLAGVGSGDSLVRAAYNVRVVNSFGTMEALCDIEPGDELLRRYWFPHWIWQLMRQHQKERWMNSWLMHRRMAAWLLGRSKLVDTCNYCLMNFAEINGHVD